MQPLTDNQTHELLTKARQALGSAPGATVRADTALKAARRALSGLALALLLAGETAADEADGL